MLNRFSQAKTIFLKSMLKHSIYIEEPTRHKVAILAVITLIASGCSRDFNDTFNHHSFKGYSIYEPIRLKHEDTMNHGEIIRLEEERVRNLKGVRNLEYIKNHLKITAYCDSNFYVYCRIGNTGEMAMIINDCSIRFNEFVLLKCDEKPIPRDKDAKIRMTGVGSGWSDIIALPSHAINKSQETCISRKRYGPYNTEETGMMVPKILKAPPNLRVNASFIDDLLDFDWTYIRKDRVYLVVRLCLFNVDRAHREEIKYYIESDSFVIDVKALKAYRQELTRLKRENMND